MRAIHVRGKSDMASGREVAEASKLMSKHLSQPELRSVNRATNYVQTIQDADDPWRAFTHGVMLVLKGTRFQSREWSSSYKMTKIRQMAAVVRARGVSDQVIDTYLWAIAETLEER
jgi:hypothetical protein